MTNIPISNNEDTQFRNPPNVVNFNSVRIPGIDEPITRSQSWWETYNGVLFSPQTQWIKQYPKYHVALVDYIKKNGTEPSDYHDAILRAFNGVPQRTGGGGSGAALNREQNIRATSAEILNQARTRGIEIGLDQLYNLAIRTVDQNLSTAEVIDAIVSMNDWASTAPGTMRADLENIKNLGRQYLINVSDDTAQEYARRISSGEMNFDGVRSAFQEQIRISHPWLQTAISAGQTPLDVLMPTRDKISRSLGINPSEVDFTNERFSKMMTVTDPNGVVRLANDRELARNIRSDNEWKNTDEARQMLAGFGTNIARVFGRSAF